VGCPREDEAFFILGAGLPPREAGPRGEHAEARVEVESTEGRYRGRLALVVADRTFTRDLESPSCLDLLKAMSLVLGVIYNDRANASADEATPSAPPPAAEIVPKPLDAPRPPLPAPKSTPANVELALLARGSFLWGPAPDASPRVEGFMEVGLARTSVFAPTLRLGAAYAQSFNTNVQGGSVAFSVTSAVAALCPVRLGGTEGRAELRPCARLDVGDLEGKSSNIPAAHQDNSLWLAPGAEIVGRWKLSPALSLEAAGTLVVPTRRQTYFIEPQAQVVNTTGAIAASAGIGLLLSVL